MGNAIEGGGADATITNGELNDGIYVADDGPGIPEDERKEIFEPGYSGGEGATGFGLAMVEEVAGAHGWEIGVTESKRRGARFETTGIQFYYSLPDISARARLVHVSVQESSRLYRNPAGEPPRCVSMQPGERIFDPQDDDPSLAIAVRVPAGEIIAE